MLKPSLARVRDTLSSLRLDKWKRGSVRDEAADDIGSILGELETNIPQLLSDADAAPETLSKLLPASRHVNALYETFLRVYDTARIAGPPEQITQIQVALKDLSSARHALDDRILQTAANQEKIVVDLRTTVQKQASFKCPVAAPPPAPACPAPPAPHKPKKKPTPPAQTTPAPSPGTPPAQQAAPTKPN
jgi:hypothetical protein